SSVPSSARWPRRATPNSRSSSASRWSCPPTTGADMEHEPAFAVADPESDPRATYALEPEEVALLTSRLVTSAEAAQATTTAPATGAPLARFPLSTPEDVERAARRARLAQAPWAA